MQQCLGDRSEGCREQFGDIQGRVALGNTQIVADLAEDVEQLETITQQEAGRRITAQQHGLSGIDHRGIAGEPMTASSESPPGYVGRARCERRVRQIQRQRYMAQDPVDLVLGADGGEIRLKLRQGLARTQKEEAARGQRILDSTQRALLGLSAEIDQEVAARDQIHPRKGRVFEQIVLGEDDTLADLVFHDEVVAALVEEALEPFRRELRRDRLGEDPGPADLDVLLLYVGREELEVRPAPRAIECLGEQDRQAVRLLAGGGARHPGPNRLVFATLGDDRLHDGLGQDVEGLRVAEEAGHRDQHLAAQHRQLPPIVVEQPDIVGQIRSMTDLHAPLDPAHYGGWFVFPEVDAALMLQQVHRLLEGVVLVDARGTPVGLDLGTRNLMDVLDDARTQGVRRQDGVDQAGGDRAARHAVEFGRLRLLGEQQTAGVVNGDRAACTVRSGAGEHHSDGLFAELLGHRGEEEVDRQGESARVLRRQAQGVARNAHHAGRRDQMDPVGLDVHVVLDRHHRHFGVAGE